MLTDWTHWLFSHHPEQIGALLWALLLIDGPRYALSKLLMCVYDTSREIWHWLRGTREMPRFTYCPSVCVIVSVYNGEHDLEAPLRSVWGTYPKLEIIIVDDGSTDRTHEVACRFARCHEGVQVLRMPERSGKSPAMNLALQYTKAEVVIGLDADAELASTAIWEVVQPLADPQVGAVSGSILGRNPFTNLVTWFQAYEFLNCVFVGRILLARLGILGIASGAFSAIRRTVLDMGYGWDEGSSLDLDLTLRIRKSGFKIAHAPYAECYTDMLPTWKALIKQRLRWDRTITIRLQGRKHVDMAFIWSRNFRGGNFVVLAESWFFSLFCMYGIAAWAIWFLVKCPPDWPYILLTLYCAYVLFELIQVVVALYYSPSPRRDALVCAVFPFIHFYHAVLMIVRLVATTQEILVRRSYSEPFPPERIRNATWHW
ncbi:MAG TPA: glycosyltransferase [Gemmataceae bacterium]|nr:glycosyltransferase [Gemmataceae bacterium]